MPAYVIADIEVTDPAGYDDYRKGVSATIAANGGRYLARGGTTEVLEGDWVPRRTVILEFPDLAAARAWYRSPAYQPLKAIRERTSRARIVIIDGLPT